MSKNNTGIGFGGLLTLLLIALKLTKVIELSWWWVLAPVWVPLALFGAFALFCLVMHLIQKLLK